MAKEEKKGLGSSLGYLGKMVGLNLIIIIALCVLGILGLSAWLGNYTRHDEKFTVPTLQGLMVDEASAYLEQAGLRAIVIDSVYADPRQRPMPRAGSIIEQVPAAGMPVKQGRNVYLTIYAYGVRMVKMKEVREGGSRQALSTLRSLGFVVDSISKEPSDMDDLVLSVTAAGRELEPGNEYPLGTHVVLHVGRRNLEIEAENEESESSFFE